MKLYVTRHGQTEWNAQNKVCGITDVRLTERGIEQAKELAELVGRYQVDLLIASPLQRAVQTGKIIAEANGIPMRTDERLIELNYGIYEGVDRKDAGFLENKRNFAFRYPGGESMMQVAGRVYRVLDGIREDYPDKNVLIVSHGGVCRVIRTYFMDMTNDEFFHYSLENCKLEEYGL